MGSFGNKKKIAVTGAWNHGNMEKIPERSYGCMGAWKKSRSVVMVSWERGKKTGTQSWFHGSVGKKPEQNKAGRELRKYSGILKEIPGMENEYHPITVFFECESV